eukprot:scaffold256730_cov32-Tisochrysis_lutea.AAC.1
MRPVCRVRKCVVEFASISITPTLMSDVANLFVACHLHEPLGGERSVAGVVAAPPPRESPSLLKGVYPYHIAREEKPRPHAGIAFGPRDAPLPLLRCGRAGSPHSAAGAQAAHAADAQAPALAAALSALRATSSHQPGATSGCAHLGAPEPCHAVFANLRLQHYPRAV